MLKVKRIIIGLTICLGLIIQSANVYAIYSPRLSQRASIVRQNVLDARQMNGVGTWLNAKEKVLEQDRENRANNTATGIAGNASKAMGMVMADIFWESFLYRLSAIDPLFMVINLMPSRGFEPISVCLRNEIWQMEDLKNVVGQEMIKAYLLVDNYHGDKLKADFKFLQTHISLLKDHGSHPTESIKVNGEDVWTTEYFFGFPTADNLYISKHANGGCPTGEFTEAFEEVWNSLQNIAAMSQGGSSGWGNIWEMAEARARVRADQWIKANQITLTIAGESGGNPQSLINGGGFDKFVGKWNTQVRIMKDMVGPVIPLFSWSLYASDTNNLNIANFCAYFHQDEGVYKACTVDELKDYKECVEDITDEQAKALDCGNFAKGVKDTNLQDARIEYDKRAEEHQRTLKEASRAFEYNMRLNSTGEESMKAFDIKLTEINAVIQRSNEAIGGESGPGLPTFFQQLKVFEEKHCPNKNN